MKMEWPKVSLGELLRLERRPVQVRPDGQYQEIGIYCFGRGIFQKPPRTGFEVGDKDLFLLKEGDFILQVTFAWEGAVAIVSAAEDGMYGSTRYPTFRVDETRCVSQFLLHYFKTDDGLQQLVKICPGSAGRNRVLSIKRIPEVLVPLPELAEQRRVVARVEVLARKIQEARKLRQQTSDEFAKLFASYLDRVVAETAKSYNSESLIDLVEPDRGISYGIVLTGAPHESGVPTLRAGDLQQFQVRLSNVKLVDPEEEKRYLRTRLRGNEVLLRIRGGLGELAICPEPMIGGNVSREIAVIPFTERVFPKYGMYALAAPSMQARMVSQLRGTSYVGINLKDVRTLQIPVPPVPEQRRIVACLDDLRVKTKSLKTLQSETSAELDALMPSILDKAFRGEL